MARKKSKVLEAPTKTKSSKPRGVVDVSALRRQTADLRADLKIMKTDRVLANSELRAAQKIVNQLNKEIEKQEKRIDAVKAKIQKATSV